MACQYRKHNIDKYRYKKISDIPITSLFTSHVTRYLLFLILCRLNDPSQRAGIFMQVEFPKAGFKPLWFSMMARRKLPSGTL